MAAGIWVEDGGDRVSMAAFKCRPPGTGQEPGTLWLCLLQGRIRMSLAHAAPSLWVWVPPLSFPTPQRTSPSSLLGARDPGAVLSHSLFDRGEKEKRWCPGHAVLSWKQPFPWDWLSWQKVTTRAGNVGWRGHERLGGVLVHLAALSRRQSLQRSPPPTHINSSLGDTRSSLQF